MGSSSVPHAALHEALEDVGAEKKKVAHDLDQKRLLLLEKKKQQLDSDEDERLPRR